MPTLAFEEAPGPRHLPVVFCPSTFAFNCAGSMRHQEPISSPAASSDRTSDINAAPIELSNTMMRSSLRQERKCADINGCKEDLSRRLQVSLGSTFTHDAPAEIASEQLFETAAA